MRKQGIDNEDRYDFSRFRYLERIRKIIGLAERHCSRKRILEVRCKVCGIKYKSFPSRREVFTIGLDINVEFLKYSRVKYKSGY